MTTTAPLPRQSRTKIVFDLADELTQEEIDRFAVKAAQAGAKSLTEHFLNITLRLASPTRPSANHAASAA